ncbi:VP7 [Letea virus]|nr:VP7 [Letea virus]
MDSIVTRTLAIVKACATLQDTRIHLDPSVVDVLGITINRYNSITERAVTLRPISQEERNHVFFMCLDMVLASLNINIGHISDVYEQQLMTAAVLATPEIPFTVSASLSYTRIRSELSSWGPSIAPHGPFTTCPSLQQPGKYYNPLAARYHVAYTDSNSLEISFDQNSQCQVNNLLRPAGLDFIRMSFIWRPIVVFSNDQGATVHNAGPQILQIRGQPFPAATILAWNGRDAIDAINQSPNQAMMKTEILWYSTLDKGLDTTPTLRSEIMNVYTFHTPAWHSLRSRICNEVNLPPTIPPIEPPNARDELLCFLSLSALADCYFALRPHLHLLDVQPLPGPMTPAAVRQAYN